LLDAVAGPGGLAAAPPPDDVAVPAWLEEPLEGADSSIVEDSPGAITGGHDANAQWDMNTNVDLGRTEWGDGWHLLVRRFDATFRWHLNGGATWNTIDQFPGGEYTPTFNMPEGSRRHEVAEIEGVRRLWAEEEREHRAFAAQGFESEAALDTALSQMSLARAGRFRAETRAISRHANPLGPDAEWAYYEMEHARWRAARPRPGSATPGQNPASPPAQPHASPASAASPGAPAAAAPTAAAAPAAPRPAAAAPASPAATRDFTRGQDLERRGEIEPAILAYEQAWASTSADPDLHRRAGEALDRLRPRVESFDHDAARRRLRGADQLYAIGRFREALAIYLENQQHSRGHDTSLQLKLARCYVALGSREALPILESLHEARGLAPGHRAEVERLLARLGPRGPTEDQSAQPPQTPEAFRQQSAAAMSNYHRGAYGAAAGGWLRLVESPLVGARRGFFLFNVGISFARLGDVAQAAAAFRRSLASGSLDPETSAIAQSYVPGGTDLPEPRAAR
jgi:tetratricopeptide (TPR) repeat protein